MEMEESFFLILGVLLWTDGIKIYSIESISIFYSDTNQHFLGANALHPSKRNFYFYVLMTRNDAY